MEVPLRGSGVVTGRSGDWGSGSSWVLGGSRWFQVVPGSGSVPAPIYTKHCFTQTVAHWLMSQFPTSMMPLLLGIPPFVCSLRSTA